MSISSPDDAYWTRIKSGNLGPGWAKSTPSLWPEPRSDFRVTHFSYALARDALHDARGFVSPAQVERRNLICVNPKQGNSYATTANLVAAYQMVAPGERARSHRHTPNALRLILDAPDGTYTVVDGCRIDMAPGDVVLTPNWCWHGHANEGHSEAYWIDFLDVPFVQHMGPMFFEPHPLGYEPIRKRNPKSPLRIPSHALPRARSDDHDACIVPIGEGWLPTIGLDLVSLSAGSSVSCEKTTANTLFAVISGSCDIVVEGNSTVISLERGDLAAIPTWTQYCLVAAIDTVLLKVSDSPALAALGLLRSATIDAPDSKAVDPILAGTLPRPLEP
jgi:gentisate 1,2-dioxygenase